MKGCFLTMHALKAITFVIVGFIVVYMIYIIIYLIYAKTVIQNITNIEYTFDYWDDEYNVLHETISLRLSNNERQELRQQFINTHIRPCISTEGRFSKTNYIVLKTDDDKYLKLYIDYPGHSAKWKLPFLPLGFNSEEYYNGNCLYFCFEGIIAPKVKDYNRIGAG